MTLVLTPAGYAHVPPEWSDEDVRLWLNGLPGFVRFDVAVRCGVVARGVECACGVAGVHWVDVE